MLILPITKQTFAVQYGEEDKMLVLATGFASNSFLESFPTLLVLQTFVIRNRTETANFSQSNYSNKIGEPIFPAAFCPFLAPFLLPFPSNPTSPLLS